MTNAQQQWFDIDTVQDSLMGSALKLNMGKL